MLAFLYGEDSFRSSEALEKTKRNFLGSADYVGLSVFDFEEKSELEIEETLFSQGLFSSKKLIIIKNLINNGPKEIQDKLKGLLLDNAYLYDDKETLIIIWEGKFPRKNNSFFKFLLSEKKCKKQEYEKLQGIQLEKWIKERAESINPKINLGKDVLQRLAAFNENMFRLSNEIEKIVAFSFSQSGKISLDQVEDILDGKTADNIFATIEALAMNDKKKALGLLLNHLEKGDDPFYLLSMFNFQFRNLLLVSDAIKNGMQNESDIARETKLHPFVVKKSLVAIRNFPREKLVAVHEQLLDLDVGAKTGKLDLKLALQKFIFDI